MAMKVVLKDESTCWKLGEVTVLGWVLAAGVGDRGYGDAWCRGFGSAGGGDSIGRSGEESLCKSCGCDIMVA